MADDLERLVRSTDGEAPSTDFATSLRAQLLAEITHPPSEAAAGAPALDVVDLRPEAEERPMKKKRMVLAAAAAAIVLIGGLALVLSNDGDSTETIEPAGPPAAPSEPVDTPAPVPGITVGPTGNADAAAGCGLSDVATVVAAVDDAAEGVTFEITSVPACGGIDVQVRAIPALQGIDIVQNVTLDDAGSGSVSDQLLGSRQAVQAWEVQLVVPETGGVASLATFSIDEFCDLRSSTEVQAEYRPDTDEVDIVLTTDPACAGRFFTFDDDNYFESSPSGGWATYEVDENGRIEVTEKLTSRATGPTFAVLAFPAPESEGAIGEVVAQAIIEIGG